MLSSLRELIRSGQGGAVALLLATAAALIAANSSYSQSFLAFWHFEIVGVSLEHAVNDGLMVLFFLLIGLELRRELETGELSSTDRALLPVFAAVGGMVVPALIHLALNAGTHTARGFGIPMATDIAFVLGVLGVLGRRVPIGLRVLVVSYAVIDDLGAILVIALFYSDDLALGYLFGAFVVGSALLAIGRGAGVRHPVPFVVLGILLWVLVLKSGVHATIAGVIFAFTLPRALADRFEHGLAYPVTWAVVPIFALANAGVTFTGGWASLLESNSAGILLGLSLGKPIGVVLACYLGRLLLRLNLPTGVSFRHLVGAGLLGGIGFTMSIFITQLAFELPSLVNASKVAILSASALSAIAGMSWLVVATHRTAE